MRTAMPIRESEEQKQAKANALRSFQPLSTDTQQIVFAQFRGGMLDRIGSYSANCASCGK